MPTLTILPHPQLCPDGLVLNDIATGTKICDALLENNIDIDHACEKSCACTTCHVIIKEGFNSLAPASDMEEDLLDQAWGLQATSRLSCQAIVGEEDLTLEIPKYTINHARENG
ncbi:MAG: ISC system 2Fe-2S type ferredoxin [Neisseriaceae bacterium]|nr:ISC system 2Fe-2S type ferredoxin [Neisseriaceae bacterium]